MSAQKRNKNKAKQQSASAPPTQEQQQANPAAAQTPQAQAINNNTALGGANGNTDGGGGAQIAESQAYGPEANPVLYLLYLSDALQRANISPEVGNLVLSNLGDRIMGMVGQLNATSGLLQQLGSLRIDPSQASTPSLEERLKRVQEVRKLVGPGMSISMEIPEGFNPSEVGQYNRAIEALMANVAAQLAARQSMLGQQLSRLLSYARRADALINSPGYVRPEELPGSIVHGRNPLDVQLISYGGIPEQDDSGEWTMRPGLGIQALFYQVPPRLDLPPLQLPTEFPKPPKPSEFKVSLSSKERSSGGSKPKPTWRAAVLDSSKAKVVNPTGEENYATTSTVSNLVGQAQATAPGSPEREAQWAVLRPAIRAFFVEGAKAQAGGLAERGARDLAIEILRQVVRNIPAYDSVDQALRDNLLHGAVFYVKPDPSRNQQGGFYFVERGERSRAHRFDDIWRPTWKQESQNAFGALEWALTNLGTIVTAVMNLDGGKYAKRFADVVGVSGVEASAIPIYAEQLAMGILTHEGRNELAAALFANEPNRVAALWNNVIHLETDRSRQSAGGQSSREGSSANSPGSRTAPLRKQSGSANNPGGTGSKRQGSNNILDLD